MDPFLYASNSDRDPPNFHDVQDLAKVYANSRELFKSGLISVQEIPELHHIGVRLGNGIIMLCTKLPVLRYFPHMILEPHRQTDGPYNYLVLDVTELNLNFNSIELLLKALPPERKIGFYKDWRKALLKAMLHAAGPINKKANPDQSRKPEK